MPLSAAPRHRSAQLQFSNKRASLSFRTVRERLGDYRFLVVNFTDAANISRYVQIWSEPYCDLTMEVGPGNREDETLKAVGDHLRPALTGRGFEIGGKASNFRKPLVATSKKSATCIANEILALVIELLGYNGATDLAYRIHQDSHLSAGHVLDGISRAQLFDWFNSWGLNPRRIEGGEWQLQQRYIQLEGLQSLSNNQLARLSAVVLLSMSGPCQDP